jgi:hypothetical protein
MGRKASAGIYIRVRRCGGNPITRLPESIAKAMALAPTQLRLEADCLRNLGIVLQYQGNLPGACTLEDDTHLSRDWEEATWFEQPGISSHGAGTLP